MNSLPMTEVKTVLCDETLPKPKVEAAQSRVMKVIATHLGKAGSKMSKEQRPLTYDVSKNRGFVEAAGLIGVASNYIEVIVGDLIVKTQLWDGRNVNGTSSMVNRMSGMKYRTRSDNNLLDSTSALRVLGIQAQVFGKPRKKYIMSEEAANMIATRMRIRPNTIGSCGDFASTLLILADVGPIQSDDWSTNAMKIYQIAYCVAPNADNSNAVPLRGMLELLDSGFTVDTTIANRVTVGINDGVIGFNEQCVTALGVRVFPYIQGDYSPTIVFMVNADDIPSDQVINAIKCPLEIARLSPQQFDTWLRLMVLWFMPSPHGLWTWDCAVQGGFQVRTSPYASQVSISGLQQAVIYVLLPVKPMSVNPPATQLEAAAACLQIPTVNGAPAEISVAADVTQYQLLEWADEFINPTLAPTQVAAFLGSVGKLLNIYDELQEAKDQMQALIFRGAPLAWHQYGTAIPIAASEPAVNSENDCDISGAEVRHLANPIPSPPAQIDYVLGSGTPLMWTLQACNIFQSTTSVPYCPIGWRKEELLYAQMLAQRYTMATQIHHDILGISILGWEDALVDSNNKLLRDYMFKLWYGNLSTSMGLNIGKLGSLTESIASLWLGTGLPKDVYGQNLLAYRSAPDRFANAYDNGSGYDTTYLKFAVFPDIMMDAWMETRALEYCQPPSIEEKGVVISTTENEFPRGAVATAVSTLVAPDQMIQIFIGQNEWFAETNWERRANRRAFQWLERHFAADGQIPSVTTNLTDRIGDQLANYTNTGTNFNLTVTAAANATIGRVDTSPDYNGKLDPWPIVDTQTWNWVVISGDASPQNLQLGVDLAADKTTVDVSRLRFINEGSSNPIVLVNNKGQKNNPLLAYMDTGDATEKAEQTQSPADMAKVNF